MLGKKSKATAVVALGVIALLVIFGIDRIGGETWLTAAASAQAGWRAGAGARVAPAASILREFLVPLLMVAAIVVVALLGAVLKRISGRKEEDASERPGLAKP